MLMLAPFVNIYTHENMGSESLRLKVSLSLSCFLTRLSCGQVSPCLARQLPIQVPCVGNVACSSPRVKGLYLASYFIRYGMDLLLAPSLEMNRHFQGEILNLCSLLVFYTISQ